jgi:two-component system CheB/CheR fusion protein
LLISVTGFVRDPESFDALAKILAGTLGKRGNTEDPVRIWVPGCATGEEVYSLAICAYEALKENQLPLTVQLFGTDISEVALDRARLG